MHYLEESGIFQRLKQVGIDMEVLETSQCMFGFPYSKPTHLAVTKQLELAHIIPPPCMKHTHFGCCQHGVKDEHLDVRKFDREVLYRLPEPLVNIIAWAAFAVIKRQNKVLGLGPGPVKPKAYDGWPTAQAIYSN